MGDQIVMQKMNVTFQVLAVMQNEASQMSWFQRFRIGWRFLWTKNIDNFFEIAGKNNKKEQRRNEKIQACEAKE
jgi:hypothetical protein